MSKDVRDEATFAELLNAIAERRAAKEQSTGAIDELMKRLKDEHDLKTVKAAEIKVEELDREAALDEKDAQKEYEAVLAELEKKERSDGKANR